jgi:lipopolysaccharide export system protein LptA
MKRIFAATLLAICMIRGAQAVAGVNLGKHNTNAPIQVSADQFTADLKAGPGGKNGTYSGNVIITQGDMHLRANTVRMNVVGNKPDKIIANGNVVFSSASSGTATGDTGVYEVGPRVITFAGRVILTKDKNVMRGSNLRINLVTGQATLNAAGSTQGGGRVQAIFTPPPQGNNSVSPSP